MLHKAAGDISYFETENFEKMVGKCMSILHVLVVCFSTVYTLECPGNGWFPGLRSCYRVQEQYNMTYQAAGFWCDEDDAWLASLETEEDFNTVVSKMNATIYSNYWFGLGVMSGCQPVTDKSCWKWTDQTEMSWMKWDDSEPNDNGAEICGKIHFRRKNSPNWRNDKCHTSYYFICEKHGVNLVPDLPPDNRNSPASASSSSSTSSSTISSTTVAMGPQNESTTMITFMEPNDSQAIIIGCVVGVIAVLAIVAVVVGVICYRRKKATKASSERSSSLYYETPGQHLTARPDVPAHDQQGSAYENIAVVSSPPYTPLRPNSDTLNYVEVDFPNNTYNSPKPTPKYEQVQYAEVVVDKSDSKVPVARRVSDLYATPMKRMKNALKKKEKSSEVQSGAYDNACNKGPTV